jgi:hypothetical protein
VPWAPAIQPKSYDASCSDYRIKDFFYACDHRFREAKICLSPSFHGSA